MTIPARRTKPSQDVEDCPGNESRNDGDKVVPAGKRAHTAPPQLPRLPRPSSYQGTQCDYHADANSHGERSLMRPVMRFSHGEIPAAFMQLEVAS